ncbi:hypothetical protein JCM3770_002512 [Rhodotorula araucariae]
MTLTHASDDKGADDKEQRGEAIRVVNRREETEAVLRREIEQADFASDVRNKALMFAGLAGLLVVAANVLLNLSWVKRVVLSLVITGCCFHALTQRLHGLSQDYSAQSASNLREPLVHPPPSSSMAQDDKVEFESAEWLNGLMTQLWPIIDRQLFVAAIDLMEDEMMALMPSMIHSVKITSLEQGSHPVHLLGMRILPPGTADPATASNFHTSARTGPAPDLPAPPFTRARHAPPSAPATSGFADPTIPRPAPFAADAEEQADDPDQAEAVAGGADAGEEGSPAVEMEVEFGYRRKVERKSEEGAERGEGKVEPMDPTENIHFVAYLGIGVSKVTTIPFPVLMSVASLRGCARVRLSFTPELPFVKTAVVGLREMPVVEVSAHPLRGSWDVVPLPIVRTFVDMAIKATLAKFVLPRRYAIDVRKVLLGGDVAMKTRTIGVVVLVLHRARLATAPARGASATTSTRAVDPLVEVSWAGMGKVLYRTRVARNVNLGSAVTAQVGDDVGEKGDESREARWEEMCFIRVPLEPVDDDAKIRLRVLNHKRLGSSPCIGTVDLPIRTLSQRPGQWRAHARDPLRSDAPRGEAERGKREDAGAGDVEYSAAFFPLLERLSGKSDAEKRKPDLMADVDLEHRAQLPAEEHEKQKRTRLDAMKELLEGREVALASHPSGILSFQIHSIADLELDTRVGAVHAGLKRLKPGVTSKAMRHAELPSSYVQAVLNDEMVFRTKLEPYSNAPSFNTGSEAFVRDWTEAVLGFAVMDYRDRDHDILAGYVSINLRDVLQEQAHLSRWFPIQGGSGSGRLRVSLLWKPLAIDLSPNIREWSVGTIQIVEASLSGLRERDFAGRLVIRAQEGEKAVVNAVRQRAARDDGADAITFDLSSTDVFLPVLSRIAPLEVIVQGVTATGVRHARRPLASGVFHVSDVQRGEPREVVVQLSRQRLEVLPDPGPLPVLKRKEGDASGDDFVDAPSVPLRGGADVAPQAQKGLPDEAPIVLTLRTRFIPGLSSLHANLVFSASSSARAAYQLHLNRRDYEAQQQDRANVGIGAEHGGADADWETATDAGGPGGSADEIEPRRDGTRARKGGSLRWVRHNAKLLTRKVKKARQHKLSEPAPETEVQASL